LAGLVAATVPKAEATLTVFRDGKTMPLKVVIGRFDETPDTITPSESSECAEMVTPTKTAVTKRELEVPCETTRSLPLLA
jgi:hypothetical protein